MTFIHYDNTRIKCTLCLTTFPRHKYVPARKDVEIKLLIELTLIKYFVKSEVKYTDLPLKSNQNV